MSGDAYDKNLPGGDARWPSARAMAVAEQVVAALRPACIRVEIAGSLRRRKPTVKDVEIVCIPRRSTDLFGEPTGECELTRMVATLMQERRLAWRGAQFKARQGVVPVMPKGAERYMSLVASRSGIPLDLFVVRPPAQWGAIMAIRTGPAEFSRALVTVARNNGLRCTEGRLVDARGEDIPTPEEADFFRACGVPWAEPWERK